MLNHTLYYIYLYFIPIPFISSATSFSLTFNPIILHPEDSDLATHLPHIFFLQNSPSHQNYPHCVLRSTLVPLLPSPAPPPSSSGLMFVFCN